MDMKFDFVIGNPPYQDNTSGDNETYAPPIYHLFMDTAYSISDKVELIHPARFLFNAGSTSKDWNKKMLNDPHFKVLYYEQDSSKVFANTDIKGGIAITYRSASDNFGVIEMFTSFPELNSILQKVYNHIEFQSIMQMRVCVHRRFKREKA
ncbi:MAG: Eco57I restriction-modification methylase domain-containing protein [Ruminococcus sp.]|nr:Eco57I restriction-modification methylase domain-containing protein [Ruminococcus sp.]